jgi:hypothetical protein
MDDEFMLSGWRKPRADFARKLRQKLDHAESEAIVHHQPRRVTRYLAYAATLLVVFGAFTLPSVRAGARAFLDLFRVVNFAPVAVRPEQIRKFNPGGKVDLPRLLGEQVVVLKEPTPPQQVATPQEAGAAAGTPVRLPAWLPPGMEQKVIEVMGESAVRVTMNTEAVNSLVDAFGIYDLRVPDEANGKSVTLQVNPIVRMDYSTSGDKPKRVMLLQGKSPVATLPEGVDLASLAEIGLRIMGLESAEAHRFANSVDWRTTLIVPVPADIATFRQIDVAGNPGLIVETRLNRQRQSAEQVDQGTHILWSSNGSVFVLMGNVHPEELFEIAQSVQ